MKLTADRPGLPARGGVRYVSIDFEPWPPPPAFDTVFVVDCSGQGEAFRPLLEALVSRLRREGPQARWVVFDRQVRVLGEAPDSLQFNDGCALREAWLRGCHAIAADLPGGRPGHCVLITQGKPGDAEPDTLPPLAGQVWEHTAIATSVLAFGHPSRTMLRALAWQGGGHYCRVRQVEEAVLLAPAPRAVLELSPPSGRILTPVRHLAAHDGALGVVVSGLRHLEVEFSFTKDEEARVSARLGEEEASFAFERGSGAHGRRSPRVMRRVAAALAQRVPTPEPAPAPPVVRTAEGGARLVGRFVPARAVWPDTMSGPWDAEVWRDSIRGSILWGAAGSALGRGLSGLDPATIRARYGAAGVREYQAFLPGLPDSAGMVSGDVHMLRELALSMGAAEGHVDPEEFGRRLVALLPRNRGMGAAAERAAHAIMDGVPWYQAGAESNSGGNGAALRVAPVGLVWALHGSLGALYRNAVVSAVVTHTHPIGVAGAVVMALAVAWCVRRRLARQPVGAQAMLAFLADQVADLESTPERRQGLRVRFADRLREVGSLLQASPEEALSVTWNGAFALESVPASLYCFLRHPDEPRAAVEVAVNAGFDADSVGSMTGHLAGAWCGAERMQQDAPTWWAGLEGRDGLIDLADRLYEMARRTG